MRRQVERELREAQTRFRRAFAEAPIGMALVDLDGPGARSTERSARCCATASRAAGVHARAGHARRGSRRGSRSGRASCVAETIDHCDVEKRFIDARGEVVWAPVSRSIVRDDAGEPLYFIAQVQDVSERRRFEAKLAHLADHDALTGLFNRRRFEHELDARSPTPTRYGRPAAAADARPRQLQVRQRHTRARDRRRTARPRRHRAARAPAHDRRDRPARRRRVRDHPARRPTRRRRSGSPTALLATISADGVVLARAPSVRVSGQHRHRGRSSAASR